MAETTGGPVNGKAQGDQTGGSLPWSPRTNIYPIKPITDPGVPTQEKIDPFGLYKYFSPAKGEFQTDALLAEISSRVSAALEGLGKAVRENDELQRENHISVAVGKLYALALMVGAYDNFDDAISAILTAVEAHKTSVYSRSEIVAIQGALEILKRSPNPGTSELTLLYEILERAGFDLNAPLTDVDIVGEEEAEF